MAQERVPEAGAAARPFDEAGDVGNRGSTLIVAEVHDAEIGLDRSERVISDLRAGGCQRREQGRFAGVRQADKADVGDEPELEAEPMLVAGLALLGVLGGLVGRGLEMGISETTPAAASDERRLARHQQVGDERARVVVVDGCTRRDLDLEILTGSTMSSSSLAPAAGSRLEVVPETKVAKRRQACVDFEEDRAAAHNISSISAASVYVILLL